MECPVSQKDLGPWELLALLLEPAVTFLPLPDTWHLRVGLRCVQRDLRPLSSLPLGLS